MKCSSRKVITHKYDEHGRLIETKEDFMLCLGEGCSRYVDKDKSATGKPVCLQE